MADSKNHKTEWSLTRRDVLLAAAAGVAIGSGLLLVPKRYFRRPQRSQAFVGKIEDYQLDIAGTISRGILELGIFPEEIKGKRILLKPNLVETALGHLILIRILSCCGGRLRRFFGSERLP
jgi:hypothetical protein